MKEIPPEDRCDAMAVNHYCPAIDDLFAAKSFCG
jgi:hypothetical protein